jgi:mannose-6-phosphate isomerase-like protein (cupin superfamily)
VDAVVRLPGEGEHVGGASSVTIKLDAEGSGGTLYLGESVLQPGFTGPPPHVHERMHDMFYVLDGVLTIRLGEEDVELPPGSFACVPPGVVHTFANRGTEPVRCLNLTTPGGWEHYIRELASLLREGNPASEEIGRVASRYDFRAV